MNTRQAPAEILVVEDSRTQAEKLRHLLERQGWTVRLARTGRMALEAVQAARPDLVISDVNMPEMNGYAMCRELKAHPRWASVPVILATQMSDAQDVIEALQCGADGFVAKPLNEQHLVGCVHDVLDTFADAAVGTDAPGSPVRIRFKGQPHDIDAGRTQLLNLLLSTYDAASQRSQELARGQAALRAQTVEMGLANRFLDSIIETIPHVIFVKTVKDLRLVRINRAFEELLGRPRDQVIGRTAQEFLPQSNVPQSLRSDSALLAGQAGADGELEIEVAAPAGTRIVRVRKLLVGDDAGQPQYVLGIGTDVTQERQDQREILRLNAELEQRTSEADAANRAKSTFLATMSHEIRTPLNGMLGMLELLALTPMDEHQRDTLEAARDSSRSLLRIVDDILDFSKMEAGQLEIAPEPVSIPRLLQDVERAYAANAAAKGLALHASSDERIAPALQADPVRLRQILSNFVSNALKFTERGSIELRADLLESAHDGSQRIRCTVRDTGIGISAEVQQRLFQPFSQGGTLAARRAGGTGLGLSICRRLAELMGGGVSMASAPGAGTTMTLDLQLPGAAPVAPPAQRASAGPVPAAPPLADALAQGRAVLVVDDHPVNRVLLVRQLNALGYAADAAAEGTQALAKWRSHRYALVLTDCEMPQMDGYALARAIRSAEAEAASARTPVIACTAHALADELHKCTVAGMDECLTKPISLDTLQRTLARWLPHPEIAQSRPGSADADSRPQEHSAPAGLALDLSLVAATWGNDPGTIRGVLHELRRANERDTADLRAACERRDATAAARAAHRMLGASRMVGAQEFGAACERLRQLAQGNDWAAVQAQVRSFELQLQRLTAHLEHVAGSPDANA